MTELDRLNRLQNLTLAKPHLRARRARTTRSTARESIALNAGSIGSHESFLDVPFVSREASKPSATLRPARRR